MAKIQIEEPIEEQEVNIQDLDEPQAKQTNDKSGTERRTPLAFLSGINKKTAVIALFVVLAFGAITVNANNEKRRLEQQLAQATSQKADSSDQNEAEDLKKEVGNLMELPADELPTIATVVDSEKVKEQDFFKNAANGDKVLLFAKDGKAILYRPTASKIIEVAPINLGTGTQGTTTQQGTE